MLGKLTGGGPIGARSAGFVEPIASSARLGELADLADLANGIGLASKTKIIVSGDRHLLAEDGYAGISIVKPRGFLDAYLSNA